MYNVDIYKGLNNETILTDTFYIDESTLIVDDQINLKPYTITAPRIVNVEPWHILVVTNPYVLTASDKNRDIYPASQLAVSFVQDVKIEGNTTTITCCSIMALLDFNSPNVQSTGLAINSPNEPKAKVTGKTFTQDVTTIAFVHEAIQLRLYYLGFKYFVSATYNGGGEVDKTLYDKATVNVLDTLNLLRAKYAYKIRANVNFRNPFSSGGTFLFTLRFTIEPATTLDVNLNDPNIVKHSLKESVTGVNAVCVSGNNPANTDMIEFICYLNDDGTIERKTTRPTTTDVVKMVYADHGYHGTNVTTNNTERLEIATNIIRENANANDVSITLKLIDCGQVHNAPKGNISEALQELDKYAFIRVWSDKLNQFLNCKITSRSFQNGFVTFYGGEAEKTLTDRVRMANRNIYVNKRNGVR